MRICNYLPYPVEFSHFLFFIFLITALLPNAHTIMYPNKTLKTNFSKISRQKLKVKLYSIERGLLYQNIILLLISVEEFGRNQSSNFDYGTVRRQFLQKCCILYIINIM